MPPVQVVNEEMAFIDDMDDFQKRNAKTDPDINELSIRVQKLRNSPQSQMVLRLQKLAKLYEESARVKRRMKFIQEKLEENEQKNRFEQATIELLKAERKRKLDNISDLGLKIIEGSNNLESERSTASETHAENSELREEQISESKKLLQGYLSITDPKPIISALPKAPHSVRRRNLSGKNKKQMEEAEDKFEIANVARFISVSSASLGHCLRVLPTPTDFEIVKTQDGKKGSVSYEDPRAEKYLRAIVDELDNLRLIRKSKGLINFIEDKSASKFSAEPVKLAINQRANLMRNDLFSRSSKSKSARSAHRQASSIPDLT
ncbi:Oidioi.mRNA.OKI2018_I69.chr2.g6050.t1.cds [Oikopleura dioica]|uniref:Oidioi.mRNA.OKI2018_I69.chr2.g6050.t1.cds n=1 Tax=Oikopleura dioica TaxID=34765 RepID=A0ABN7T2D6_OIKDI|nr:Oidioi.mRNA.OKI2018_I69.chr2.g6050.t1.cds [Oikopleura dioica]